MQSLRRAIIAALLIAPVMAAVSALPVHRALAQSTQAGINLFDLGTQKLTGTSWSFSGDFAVTAGAFESITISNYGYCFVGPNDPRQGTAHAGGVFYFAELTGPAGPDNVYGYTYDGDFRAGRGGNVKGTVTVSTNSDPSNPATHVDVTLSGSDLSFYSNNTLQVCLLGSS